MSNIKIPVRILALLLLPAFLPAQSADPSICPELLEKANAAVDAKNWNKARDYCETALPLCPGAGIELNKLLSRVEQGILAQRDEAERNAVLAKKSAREATDALKQVEAQRQIADSALQNLQIIADQAVPIVLADIDRNIYRLEYDSTYEKCATALGLGARRGEVEKRIHEIAYFYTEADSAAAALAFLDLLEPTGLTAATPRLQDSLRARLKRTVPADYLDSLEKRYYPTLVAVEGGSFWQRPIDFLGRPVGDSALVNVRSFQIGETEITYRQYNVFARAEKYHIEPPSWEFCGDNPAVYVNWYDAAFYCNWLSKRHGKDTVYAMTNPTKGIYTVDYDVEIHTAANGYRLPTDAEWEFAARGGNKSRGFEYSGDSILTNVGWYAENSNNRTRAVRHRNPNELYLYDMSGNVWEWCQDWYSEGSGRVVRGGSWGFNAEYCRVALRTYGHPDDRFGYQGFRLVFVP